MKADVALSQVLQRQFILKVDDAYGDKGVEDFKCCLSRIRSLYQRITLPRYATITAFVGNHSFLNGKGKEMRMDNVHSVEVINLTVRLVDDDSVIIYRDDEIEMGTLLERTFVYFWERGNENPDHFFINGTLEPFSDGVTPDEGSFFAVRTYGDLDEALINYRDNIAPMCVGRALIESMIPTRLFFYPGPEDLLQEALYEYLESRLRNCDVNREHNVDNSHPVDIIVRWRGTNHLALIEIKWIGKALNKEGAIGTTYSDARANEGAAQLIGYIDNNADSFPRDVSEGYLVVYDLRRKNNLDVSRTKMKRTDANHFEHIEINFNPQYDMTRMDFNKPYRFFVKVSNDVYED